MMPHTRRLLNTAGHFPVRPLLPAVLMLPVILITPGCRRDNNTEPGTPAASADAGENMQNTRTVTFPDEPVIGSLAVRANDADLHDPWQDKGSARGVITVRNNEDLLLVVFHDINFDQFSRVIRSLSENDVQAIYLNDTGADDTWINELPRLPGLRIVGVRGCAVTDAALPVLVKLPALQRLVLSDTRVTDAAVPLINSIKTLRDLDLSRTMITDEGLVKLNDLPDLRTLRLPPATTDHGLSCTENLPALEHLDATDTKITDAGLVHLRKLPLRRLNLSRTGVTGAGFVNVSGMKSLRDLLVRNTAVDDSLFDYIADLSELRRVFIGDSRISREGAQHFRENHPSCRLVP
ncbi:MAG TPA: hypothetical protein ENJ06_01805 [Phycisphaeraceae bacterium]|nr:hypothetical protein [Phycisphaeraceae bacterium]